ncbi:MAG: hypothetical protein N3B01_07125, partial [Verrucomicrobiae bacterium]|nr:hypothetical protein [Verrucomicrobiae bacterium]
LAGLAAVVHWHNPVLLTAALQFLICLVAIFVFEGQGRYTVPAMPASALLIAAALTTAEHLLRRMIAPVRATVTTSA